MAETQFDSTRHPHRRFNPLTGQWVLISPHRLLRPWQGQVDDAPPAAIASFDADCPLCPGNNRAGEAANPDYDQTFVFENDFAALQTNTPESPSAVDPIFRQHSARGRARVICFSPDHGKTLPELSLDAIGTIIRTWKSEVDLLKKDFAWVQVFENKGAMMGSSQPHPHGQVWASDFVPNEIAIRDRHQHQYFREQGSNLLIDYLQRELENGERIVVETDHWAALVPYWAAWPFETMLLPKQHAPRFEDLTGEQQQDLAPAIKELLTRYDNLFQCSFPYSMGWHYAPFNGDARHWQLNAVFYPPLLRSATVRKFMVGYEMLAEAQRDLTPEQAAQRLRDVSTVHYRNN